MKKSYVVFETLLWNKIPIFFSRVNLRQKSGFGCYSWLWCSTSHAGQRGQALLARRLIHRKQEG